MDARIALARDGLSVALQAHVADGAGMPLRALVIGVELGGGVRTRRVRACGGHVALNQVEGSHVASPIAGDEREGLDRDAGLCAVSADGALEALPDVACGEVGRLEDPEIALATRAVE